MSQFQQPPFQQPNYPQPPFQQSAYQQPGIYQQQAPQSPTPQPQQPSPIRKRKRSWEPWQLALVWFIAGLIIGYAVHTQSSQPTTSPTQASATQTTIAQTPASTVALSPTPTPKPTQPPQWTTVQTFTGSGIKKTGIFTVPDDWKIVWSCNPSSSYGGSYNVQVMVYNSDNSLADLAVNVICQAGTTHDVTEEHQGGNVYLEINSEGAWTIQIQELK